MIGHDVTFALRMLCKAPGFTMAAMLAIALGVGANTAIFTVVERVLLQPLAYPGPARIVDVDERANGRSTTVSPPNFLDWRTQNRTLAALAAYSERTVTLSGGREALRLEGAAIDAQVLPVLGVAPALGRGFVEDDAREGARAVAILGHGAWQRLFGADPGIIGRTIALEGAPCEVIGVMPPGFDFPEEKEVWIPLVLTSRDTGPNQRGAHYLSAVGRLRDGASLDQARDDLNGIEQAIARQYPSKVTGYAVSVEPLRDSMVGGVQRPLWILFGAVGFVMLIACVNVSNLLLARASTRTGEIAVRSALGADRWRLVRQLLAESAVLALAGGAAGALIGSWSVRALMAIAPADLPRAGDVRMDPGVLLFSLVLSLVAGIVFGSAPALVASRPDLAVFLKDVRRDGGSAGGRRALRSVLVAAQMALALVLLTGAGLAARSFSSLVQVDPGIRTSGVLTFEIVLPEAAYPSLVSIAQFYRDYIERIQREPGIATAGAISFAPLTTQGFGGTFTLLDRPQAASEGNAQVRSVTPGYMETVAMPLRAGRFFDARDAESAPRVAIVSEAAARRYWPGESPIGKRIRLHVNESVRAPREIVGVVGDVHIHRLDIDAVPVIYVPHTQYGPETMTIMARTAGDPLLALPGLKGVLSAMAPDVAIGHVRTLDAIAAASVAQPRFRAVLLSVFAAVSLALAAVGLYGVVAFSVTQRRTELGLRIALGADAGDVLRLVLREGMAPVAAGILIGLGASAVLERVMQTLLFNVDALDPVTFAAVSGMLAVVALAACYIPARRATRLDPAATLR